MITMDPIGFIILLVGIPISIYAYHFELKLLWNSVQIAKNGKMLMGQLTPEQAKQMLSMAEGYYTKKYKKGKNKKDKDDISYGSIYQ